MTDTTILQVQGLGKRYGSLRALNDFSLTLQKGQIYGILGPNGSGKTTFLSLILGVLRPSGGSISWFSKGNPDTIKRNVGSLLEQPNFYPWLSAKKNLTLVALIRGVSPRSSAIQEALRIVKLDNVDEPFGKFSLGMKQRLAIAAAILGNPEVLVFDEPTNGIDAEGIAEIRRLILDFAKQGKTIILASHILDEIEKICSHVVILKKGQIIESGQISQVLSESAYIEIASPNLSDLKRTLESFDIPWEKIEVVDSVLRLQSKSHISLSDLNRRLAEKGIYVDHLTQRKSSLEAHFLNKMELN